MHIHRSRLLADMGLSVEIVPPRWDVVFAHYATLAAFTLLWGLVGVLWVIILARVSNSKRMRLIYASVVAGASSEGNSRTEVLRLPIS